MPVTSSQPFFSIIMSRNGNLLLSAISIVKWIDGWHSFKVAKRVVALWMSGNEDSVSMTFLLWNDSNWFSHSSCSSIEHRKALATRGPKGEPTATPSTCPYSLPSNWNSWLFVATCNNSTRLDFLIFSLCVTLNQLFLNAFSTRIWIVSSRGTLVNKEDTS